MEQQDDSKASDIIDNGEHFACTFVDIIKDLIKRVERLERATPSACFVRMPDSRFKDRFD